jgi:hypothetical protein
MTGEPTYVRIDPKVTRVAVELYPKLAEYVEGDGCLYTLLLKALYGCVQASALWYALIKSVLIEYGLRSRADGPVRVCKTGLKLLVVGNGYSTRLRLPGKSVLRLRERLRLSPWG